MDILLGSNARAELCNRSERCAFYSLNGSDMEENITYKLDSRRFARYWEGRWCAASMPSWAADQSNRAVKDDSRNGSGEWPEAMTAV